MDKRGECGGIASPGVKVLPFREVHKILEAFEPARKSKSPKAQPKAQPKAKLGAASAAKPASAACAQRGATVGAGAAQEEWTYVPTARGFKALSVRSLARFKGRVVRKIAGSDGPWTVTKRLRGTLPGASALECTFLKLREGGWVCDVSPKSKELLLQEEAQAKARAIGGIFSKVARVVDVLSRPSTAGAPPRAVSRGVRAAARKSAEARKPAVKAGRAKAGRAKAGRAKAGPAKAGPAKAGPAKASHVRGAKKARLASAAVGLFRTMTASLQEVGQSGDPGAAMPAGGSQAKKVKKAKKVVQRSALVKAAVRPRAPTHAPVRPHPPSTAPKAAAAKKVKKVKKVVQRAALVKAAVRPRAPTHAPVRPHPPTTAPALPRRVAEPPHRAEPTRPLAAASNPQAKKTNANTQLKQKKKTHRTTGAAPPLPLQVAEAGPPSLPSRHLSMRRSVLRVTATAKQQVCAMCLYFSRASSGGTFDGVMSPLRLISNAPRPSFLPSLTLPRSIPRN